MIDKFTAGTVIVLLITCGWLYYDTRSLSEENGQLTALVQSSETYIAYLEKNIKLTEQIMSQREEFEVFIKEYSDANQKALHDLLRNDAKANDWSNTPIPSGFLRLHKNSATARTGTPTNSNSAAGTDSVSGTERND